MNHHHHRLGQSTTTNNNNSNDNDDDDDAKQKRQDVEIVCTRPGAYAVQEPAKGRSSEQQLRLKAPPNNSSADDNDDDDDCGSSDLTEPRSNKDDEYNHNNNNNEAATAAFVVVAAQAVDNDNNNEAQMQERAKTLEQQAARIAQLEEQARQVRQMEIAVFRLALKKKKQQQKKQLLVDTTTTTTTTQKDTSHSSTDVETGRTTQELWFQPSPSAENSEVDSFSLDYSTTTSTSSDEGRHKLWQCCRSHGRYGCCCRRLSVMVLIVLVVIAAVVAVSLLVLVDNDNNNNTATPDHAGPPNMMEITTPAPTRAPLTTPGSLSPTTEPTALPTAAPSALPTAAPLYWSPLTGGSGSGSGLQATTANAFLGASLALHGNLVASAVVVNDNDTTAVVQLFAYQAQTKEWSAPLAVLEVNDPQPSLALSSSVLAVGSPATNQVHILRKSNDNDSSADSWTVETVLQGVAVGDAFGTAVSLSADGKVLAVGAPENDDRARIAGHVRVYGYDDNHSSNNNKAAWKQLGVFLGSGDLEGQFAGDRFGSAVAVSADGLVVAAGAQRNDDNGGDAGHVRVFRYDSWLDQWKPLGGSAVVGAAAGDWFGKAVALSADGSVLAATSRRSSANGKNAGEVRVMRLDSETNAWVSMGESILGRNAGDHFGTSVSLSADGTLVACGATHYDDTAGNNVGAVQLLGYDSATDEWNQVGETIEGERAGDFFGTTVALSADGTVVASGGPSHDDDEAGLSNTGQIRVFAAPPSEE